MSGAAFAGVSRRGLLALVALGSVSGCGGPSVEEQAAKDRYITLIKQDASVSYGYSRDGKRFAGLVQITFDAHPTIANDGFYITFEAPTA